MKSVLQEKGFSLVEIIIVIAVASIILPMTMVIVSEMTKTTSKSGQITIATDLAREMMELINTRRFDENQPSEPTDPATDWTAVVDLGTDAGENPTVRTTFDDKDDFDGYSDIPISGYSRNVQVVYATLDTTPNPDAWVAETGGPTNYKRITVNVTHDATGTITLATLAGGWGN